jgi:hypothetical protein
MSDAARRAAYGRIGGLRAWALNDAEVMLGAAHRGFRRRFENIVDPDGRLSEPERAARAERALRAHMLTLAARSAAARRKPAPDRDSGAGSEVRHPDAEQPAAR